MRDLARILRAPYWTFVTKDQGRVDDAIASYAKALAIKPDYLETHKYKDWLLSETIEVPYKFQGFSMP